MRIERGLKRSAIGTGAAGFERSNGTLLAVLLNSSVGICTASAQEKNSGQLPVPSCQRKIHQGETGNPGSQERCDAD
jgi:hypothetical protein